MSIYAQAAKTHINQFEASKIIILQQILKARWFGGMEENLESAARTHLSTPSFDQDSEMQSPITPLIASKCDIGIKQEGSRHIQKCPPLAALTAESVYETAWISRSLFGLQLLYTSVGVLACYYA
ncbi:hypothetical protein TNCV_4927031 [Trichonephila clavipes]|nr:hypothetical protein TNCV_4927031 [Trichonephila clavipes]